MSKSRPSFRRSPARVKVDMDRFKAMVGNALLTIVGSDAYQIAKANPSIFRIVPAKEKESVPKAMIYRIWTEAD